MIFNITTITKLLSKLVERMFKCLGRTSSVQESLKRSVVAHQAFGKSSQRTVIVNQTLGEAVSSSDNYRLCSPIIEKVLV